MASTHKRNPSPSPSISSVISDINSDVSSEEADVRNYAKKRLNKRLFLGHYQERRYVENLGVYRDMVVLHKSEIDLQVDIERVQAKLISFYRSSKWLGITSPDIVGAPAAGYCFWTKLQDVAFGFYWFQLRQIRYDEKEVLVRLKVIRSVSEEVVTPSIAPTTSFSKSLSDNIDSLKTHFRASIHSLKECGPSPVSSKHDASQESCSQPSKSVPEDKGKETDSPASDEKVTTESLKMGDAKILWQAAIHNWKEIFVFLSVALVGTLNRLGKCVEYVGNFSLRFMHEFSCLLRTVTPIVLAVIELCGKLVGGLYLLIAMLFQNGRVPPQQFIRQNQIRRPPAAIQNVNYPRGNSRF